MKISALEELVMLIVGVLKEEAYGVAIKEMLEEKTGKKPSIGALHSALYRLEEKGFLSAKEGGATNERGGRRKKFYKLTANGQQALVDVNELRMEFAKQIPGLNIN